MAYSPCERGSRTADGKKEGKISKLERGGMKKGGLRMTWYDLDMDRGKLIRPSTGYGKQVTKERHAIVEEGDCR